MIYKENLIRSSLEKFFKKIFYDYIKRGLGCVKDCGAGYLGKEKACIDSALGCGENYRDMGGWCNRIRYTPAEAAEVLRDDNSNSVTITFKK